jgi:hypothetical protein
MSSMAVPRPVPQPAPERAQPTLKQILVIGSVISVPLIGGVLLYRALAGGITGDVCNDRLCKPGHVCVELPGRQRDRVKQCAATCESHAECPRGFRCMRFVVRDDTFGGTSQPVGASKACLP